MYKLIHYFVLIFLEFCGFIAVAYTVLNKLLAVFICIIYIYIYNTIIIFLVKVNLLCVVTCVDRTGSTMDVGVSRGTPTCRIMTKEDVYVFTLL